MKVWYEFIAEDPGEHWAILSDDSKELTIEERTSSNGGEPVMKMKRFPGEFISVNIISASQEIDTVTKRIGFEKEFYIQVECLKSGWKCISEHKYNMDESLNLARKFLGMPTVVAQKLWKMKKLGENSNRINY